MGVEAIVDSYKTADSGLVRLYRNATRNWEERVGSRYVLTNILTCSGLVAKLACVATFGPVDYVYLGIIASDVVRNVMRGEHYRNIFTRACKMLSLSRLPLAAGGVFYLGKGAVELAHAKSDPQLMHVAMDDLLLAYSTIAVSTSMAVKDA